ncbi:hypothetical protein D3C85_1386510 [compost metagenome]
MKILHSSRSRAVAGKLTLALQRTVDLDQWRAAPSWRERLGAISWLRVSAIAVIPAIAIGCCLIAFMPRGVRAYPPPLPSKTVMELRKQGLKDFKNLPPAGLADANRSISETSAS